LHGFKNINYLTWFTFFLSVWSWFQYYYTFQDESCLEFGPTCLEDLWLDL